jgi:hypothetical protein
LNRVKDETGNRYGRLTVLERAPEEHMRGAFWLCRCDCGAVVIICGRHLRSGNTRSCGCLRSEIASARINEMHRRKRETPC